MSPSSWATACSRISATPKRMRTMPSAPCGLVWRSPERSEICRRRGRRLSTRIGIATGRVVVGDLIGEGAAQEEAVVGETPNLAARLQALAEPGSVVIAPGTRRLIGGLFELADLGAHASQGLQRAGARLAGRGRRRGRKPLRGAARPTPDPARRSRGRAASAARALAARGGRRGPGGAALRRARDRQVADRPGAARAARRTSRTRRSATTARPITPPARSIRSSVCWSARPASPATTRPRPGWTSSRLCSPRVPSSWPRPCR